MSDTKILVTVLIFISLTGLLIYSINQLVTDPVEYTHQLDTSQALPEPPMNWWQRLTHAAAAITDPLKDIYRLFTFKIEGIPPTLSLILAFLIYTPMAVVLLIVGLNYVRGN